MIQLVLATVTLEYASLSLARECNCEKILSRLPECKEPVGGSSVLT